MNLAPNILEFILASLWMGFLVSVMILGGLFLVVFLIFVAIAEGIYIGKDYFKNKQKISY